MRRKIAHLLVFVLVLTNLQGLVFSASGTPYDFNVIDSIFTEQSSGLVSGSRDSKTEETAMAKWDISSAGKYRLVYYIQSKNANNLLNQKVELDFENLDGVNIKLNAKTYTISEDGTTKLDTNSYTTRDINNSTNAWESTAQAATDVIEKDFMIGSQVARVNREFNVIFNNISMEMSDKTENLHIRMKLDGEIMYIYTNGIAKGNIVRFELLGFDAIKGDYDKLTQEEFFNGPKNYEVVPTHLYMKDGKMESLDVIEDPQIIKPGSKPGVKIKFDKIKQADEHGIFKEITTGTAKKVTLIIGPEYTLDTVTDGIRMDFMPLPGSTVTIDAAQTVANAVNEEDDKLTIYMANEALEGADKNIITWDVLEASMIVNGSFQYGSTGSKYWPSNKGYTYLSYSMNKTNNNQAQLLIQPYNIKAKATYSIYIGTDEGSLDENNMSKLKPQVVYEYDPNKTDNSMITAIVPTQTLSYFKIKVEINEHTFYSQVVKYNPKDFPATPEVTEIKSIDNVYVVPSEEKASNAQPQAIGFDIEWLAPDGLTATLANGDLYYELLLRKDKDDMDPLLKTSSSSADNYATYSKVFKVSLNDEGKVIVSPVMGTAGGDNNNSPNVRYSATNKTFTMESVSLKNFDRGEKWEQLNVPSNHLSVSPEDYLTQMKVEDSLDDRTIPGNFYLSFRTVYIDHDTTKTIVYSAESNLVSLALDNVEEIIPVPDTITGEDTTVTTANVSEKISFNLVDIKSYVKKMLEPAKAYLYKDEAMTNGRYSGTYEIYLYQKADGLADTIKKVEAGKIIPINLSTGSQLNIQINRDGKKDIDRLRDGEVIPLTIDLDSLKGLGNGNFEIQGLDTNQVYYIKMRVKLTPWRNSLNNLLGARYSLFSKEFSFTTSTTPLPPTADDKVPPVPEDIWIVEQANNTSVTLGWAPAEFEEDEDVTKTYYEFIRAENKLKDEEMSKGIEELVQADETKVGFRSDSPTESEPFMNTYTNSGKSWVRLDPAQGSNLFRLTDHTLAPNNVYYFYVRTVCVIDGKLVKSGWIMVPVTTSPVKPPINLKVETVKAYDHDPATEIVISFDAPLSEGAKVPQDYDFDIAVKSELDDEYRLDYEVEKITASESSTTPDGYTHFVYKITELKANKRYDIKVRTIDKTIEITSGETYPRSLYTDKVTTRTEYDEDEQIKDDKYEDYLKEFDSGTEKLKRKPYWTASKGEVYKYRESYMNTEIGLKGTYELVTEDDTTDVYYYMPANTIYLANDKKTTLQVKMGDETISIRPNTLTKDNEVLEDAIDALSERDIRDYYISFHFTTTKHDGTAISGETVLTPEIALRMEVVYMEEEEMIIEDDIMIALEELIEEQRLDVIEKLEKKLDKGVLDDDTLGKIIDDALEDIEEDHAKKVKNIMKKHKDKSHSIKTIERPILIQAIFESYAANGYYYNGATWLSVDCYALSNGYALEADLLGIYIFTGQKSLLDTVPSLAPYQSFIGKYHLGDFFSLTAVGVKQTANKNQVYSALARVLGAARGADYILFLKGKDIKGVTSIGTSSKIRQDETVYVVMQGYEKLYNKPIAAIAIRNRQSVQNIGAFQAQYRNYVYAAVELKIIDNPNSKVIPSKEMTVEEIIKILYKVHAK